MSDKKNFKEGLKGTALFGGVGILSIFISIVKSKLVAVLLGPEGMGILGLFNSSVDLINKSTNFSLRTSAVRDISGAFSSGDNDQLANSYSIFGKLIKLTGLLGLVVCILAAPYLSLSSFGGYHYSHAFIVLALSFPLIQLSDGLNVLMQGTRHLKLLAKSNLVGNSLALLAVVPLYFFFGIKGLVFTIVISYLVHYLVTNWYTKKIDIITIPINFRQAILQGKGMLKMGFFISLQSIFVALSAYALRAIISHTASVEQVGLYTAGFYIVNTYTGLVFSGMSTEYYPRIASMSSDNGAIFRAVESQTELSLMLLSPLVSALILLGDVAVKILYSEDFLGISMMINFSMLGMFFKAPSWCLGYVFLGKGDSKVYFRNELLAIVYTLLFNILFYNFWGLTGIGVSYLFSYLLYWIQQILVCKYYYNYVFDGTVFKIIIPQISVAVLCLICSTSDNSIIKYFLGFILIIISAVFSYFTLRRFINIANVIKQLFKNK